MAGNLIGFERFAVTSLYVTVGVGSTFVCRGTNPVAHFSPQCFLVGIARPSGWLDRHARPSRQSFLFLTNPSPVPAPQSPILRTPLGFGCRPCIGIYPAVCQQMCVARGGGQAQLGHQCIGFQVGRVFPDAFLAWHLRLWREKESLAPISAATAGCKEP
jgi:hypothetical protein